MDPQIKERKQRLVDDAPALTSPSWLPVDSGIEWLDSLGADHRRLLAARQAAAHEVAGLPQRFEREDEERREAMTTALRAGRESELPEPTTPEQRRAALAAAEERLAAANDALDGFITDAIATLEERAAEWLAGLAERREQAAEKRREAQRLVAQADAEEAKTWRLEEWVKRNAGIHERGAFRRVAGFRYAGWDLMVTINPPADTRDATDLRPQLSDPPSLPDWQQQRHQRSTTTKED